MWNFKTLTVSRSLNEQGWVSDKDFALERYYNEHSLFALWINVYAFLITPFGYLIRHQAWAGPVANFLARKIWIDRAIRKGREMLEHEDEARRLL